MKCTPLFNQRVSDNFLLNLFPEHISAGLPKSLNLLRELPLHKSHLSCRDNEVSIKYHGSNKHGKGMFLLVGSNVDVDIDKLASVLNFFFGVRWQSAIDESKYSPCFVEELFERGYDLRSLSFTLKTSSKPLRKFGSPRWKPNNVKFQYGVLKDSAADYVVLRGGGIHTGDGLLVLDNFCRGRLVLHPFTQLPSFLDMIAELGFEPKETKFSISKYSK
ncbi:hypothetical protein [Vibrio sp. D431a]|uniref:hypothetical protein n=1 Tax=Vibrio sp. D431a TaxID=2837388 RepID=UPI00255548A5|nr:hypothetical protein [Vibrio sp. D431a]MDK9789862.1 hypothetical protein [Vibrio sp. D431a]